MINALLLRLHYANTPVESLSLHQRNALAAFRHKLAQGVYSFESVACLCGMTDSLLIARRDRYALPVHTHLCRRCGTMWTSPRMTEQSLLVFYQDDYRPIYVGSLQPPDDFFLAEVQRGKTICEFVESCIPSKSRLTVFDVGCGAGGVLVPLREAGWRVYGCDVGSEYLQRGRAAGLALEHGDPSVLAQHGLANLVILSHALEHFPDPRRSLHLISGLLVDNGYIYVELPGIFSIHRTYGDILLFLQNAHLYHFTLTTLSALMTQLGFKLVKGDEQIRALFQKVTPVPFVSREGQFRRIWIYLQFIETSRLLLGSCLLRRTAGFTARIGQRWRLLA